MAPIKNNSVNNAEPKQLRKKIGSIKKALQADPRNAVLRSELAQARAFKKGKSMGKATPVKQEPKVKIAKREGMGSLHKVGDMKVKLEQMNMKISTARKEMLTDPSNTSLKDKLESLVASRKAFKQAIGKKAFKTLKKELKVTKSIKDNDDVAPISGLKDDAKSVKTTEDMKLKLRHLNAKIEGARRAAHANPGNCSLRNKLDNLVARRKAFKQVIGKKAFKNLKMELKACSAVQSQKNLVPITEELYSKFMAINKKVAATRKTIHEQPDNLKLKAMLKTLIDSRVAFKSCVGKETLIQLKMMKENDIKCRKALKERFQQAKRAWKADPKNQELRRAFIALKTRQSMINKNINATPAKVEGGIENVNMKSLNFSIFKVREACIADPGNAELKKALRGLKLRRNAIAAQRIHGQQTGCKKTMKQGPKVGRNKSPNKPHAPQTIKVVVA